MRSRTNAILLEKHTENDYYHLVRILTFRAQCSNSFDDIHSETCSESRDK